MAGHELDNKAEHMESRQMSTLSSLAPELLTNGSALRQLNKVESTATITNNGFPALELFDSGSSQMKADSTQKFSSKYETGSELRSDRELKQAGLHPKDVKHTTEKQDDGWTSESTSVKYPNGIEVKVEGHTKHTSHGTDVVVNPTATIKEPLPKGYTTDKDGAIMDPAKHKIGQINEDGTVTMKVGKDYVTQSPAGITEETVFERKDGTGMLDRLKH
jgi:hypothetical protein